MNAMIKTEGLTKTFKDVMAVSDVSLNIEKGEIYGFLGLNGAGKTTTIRMLLGMISPVKGKAFINGSKVHAGNTGIWKQIGYMVETPSAWPGLTVRENLEIFRRLRLLDDRNAVESVMNKLKLNPYADRKAGNLSLGNAQRLGIAKAMIHNPDILILDEPANGLDPEGILEIREMLRDLARMHGVTIFISSHILSEVSKFATRIGIIHHGVLINELSTHELEEIRQKRLVVKTGNNEAARSLLRDNGIPAEYSGEGMLEIRSAAAITNPENIATLLVNQNIPPSLLNVVEEDLESYFLRTIKMKGNGQ